MSDDFKIPDTTQAWEGDEALACTALPNVDPDDAYRQGWWAYGFGNGREANPYDGTELAYAYGEWLDGWGDALGDDEG